MKTMLRVLLLCLYSGSLAVAQSGEDEACAQAEALVTQCDELIKAGKLKDAAAKVKEAMRTLREADPKNKSRKVMAVRWKCGERANHLALPELRREAWSRIISFYEGVDADKNGGKDREYLQKARAWLAITYGEGGELQKALKLQERIVKVYEGYCQAEDPRLLDARSKCSITLNMMGDVLEAKKIQEELLAIWEEKTTGRQLDDNEFYNLNKARLDLANTMFDLTDGHHTRPKELRSTVVTAYEKRVWKDGEIPAWAKEALASARVELSTCYVATRDYERARRCLDQALASFRAQKFPEHHPNIINALLETAYCQQMIGDYAGARPIYEECLKTQRDHLAPGAMSIQQTRLNLARLFVFMDELKNALDLSKAGVEALEKQGFGDDSWVMENARTIHASVLVALGKASEARKIMQGMVARYRKNPIRRLAACVGDLACTHLAAGDLQLADETFEKAFEVLDPAFHDFNGLSYFRRIWALALSGRALEKGATAKVKKEARSRLAGLLRTMVKESKDAFQRICALSPREVGQIVDEVNRNMSVVLSLAGRDAALQKDAFELLESARGASIRTLAVVRRSLAKVEATQEKAWEAIWHESHLVSKMDNAKDSASLKKELQEARAHLEAVMRELVAKCQDEGLAPLDIDVGRVAKALPENSAAVAFRRFSEWSKKPVLGHMGKKEDWLAAHVVQKNGKLVFKKLVRIEELRTLVGQWRSSIGKDVDRGDKRADPAKKAELKHGSKLYALVLKPVLKLSRDAKVLHVCLDDALHLVPLDALPVSARELVGDKIRIRYYSSFDRLVHPPKTLQSSPSLLSVGGVDYDKTAGAPTASAPSGAASPPRVRGKGPGGESWAPLNETLDEAKNVRDRFLKTHAGQPATVISGTDATKPRVTKEMTEVRFIHVATHGYFDDWSMDAVEADDDGEQGWRPSSLEETVMGLAPMACCGLVMAGANKLNDTDPSLGVITAEELACLDLSKCELATLSACNTNRGILSSGQGIQSLRTALHAAGARSAITSLWKVSDEASRKLMNEFYHNLFIKKLSKLEALEEAKKTLRGRRSDFKDTKYWAGWILTGDA